jgi:hypothetical protein
MKAFGITVVLLLVHQQLVEDSRAQSVCKKSIFHLEFDILAEWCKKNTHKMLNSLAALCQSFIFLGNTLHTALASILDLVYEVTNIKI